VSEPARNVVIGGLIDIVWSARKRSSWCVRNGAMLSQHELARVANDVSDDVVGFGPIEASLQDPDVTEVMANGPTYGRQHRVSRDARATTHDALDDPVTAAGNMRGRIYKHGTA
jgi:Flp pilus assembly CpaF family ATPase